MAASIALIIRCFNEEAHIGRLLTGVSRQTVRPDETIVVDSGSTDATVSIAKAFGARIVSISPEDFSFGAALNLGLRFVQDAELAVLASAHVYPIYDTWLEKLIAPFDDGSIALAYGRQQTPPGGRFSEQRLLGQWFPGTSQHRQRHPFCNNANAAIRTEIWADLPYNEELTGLEDLDWAKRALERGWKLAYVAEAPVIHVHAETFAQVVNRYRREAIAHKQIYDDQKMSGLLASRLAVANILADFREAMSSGILRHHLTEIPRFRVAQFLGTYQGFAQSGPVTDVLRRRFYYPGSSVADGPGYSGLPPGRVIDYDLPGRM